jgi:hypothetical protein
MKLITETHAEHIRGTLSCYDRVIIQGTLPPFCYASGMTSFLYEKNIRVFDKQSYLQGMYDTIVRTAIHTVKPENIATFLGKKLYGNYQNVWATDSIPALKALALSTSWDPPG